MKKRSITVLTAALITSGLMLAGCSGESGNAAGSPTVVKIWVPTSGANPIDEQFVKKFNASHKDIKVEYTAMASDTQNRNLTLALRTGVGPDLMIGPSPAELINPGFALPLNGKLDAKTMAAYEGYLEGKFDYVVDGKFYEVPQNLNGTRMLINRDLFKQAGLDPNKPPTTYSEVIAAAKAITDSSDGKAYGFGLPLAWNGVEQNHIEPLPMASDPTLTRVGLFSTKTQKFETGDYAPAIKMYRTLIKDGSMYPGAGTLDRDSLRAAFSKGEVGMYIGSSIEIGVLNNQLKSNVDWTPTRIPVEDGKEFVRSSATVSGGPIVNAATEHVDASIKVLEAWSGYDHMCAITKAGLNIPIRNDLDKCAPTGIKGYQEFLPTKESGDKPDGVSPGNSLTVPGAPYETVIAKLVLGDADPGPVLKELGDRFDKAYKKAVDSGQLKSENFK